MIRSIVLEQLPTGALPVYDLSPEQQTYFSLEIDRWEQQFSGPNRMFLNMGIDTTLEEFEGNLRRWVAEAQHLVEGVEGFSQEGTLMFVIHVLEETPENTHFGRLLIAGMVYLPQALDYAVDLDGSDPADLIMMLCRDEHNPIIQDVLGRQRRHRQEEIRLHQRYWEMSEAARKIEAKKARQAEKRAGQLLARHLTHRQRRQLRTKRYIEVQGQDQNLYRITACAHQNVFLIEGGKAVTQFCVVSSISMPIADLMLVQKLLLETNLDHFMSLANRWDLRDGERVRVIPIPGVHVNLIEEAWVDPILGRLELDEAV
jgi:hypothetical protein